MFQTREASLSISFFEASQAPFCHLVILPHFYLIVLSNPVQPPGLCLGSDPGWSFDLAFPFEVDRPAASS